MPKRQKVMLLRWCRRYEDKGRVVRVLSTEPDHWLTAILNDAISRGFPEGPALVNQLIPLPKSWLPHRAEFGMVDPENHCRWLITPGYADDYTEPDLQEEAA